MPLTLPEKPTPEALKAIRAALTAPLTATPEAADWLRERTIYRAIVRAVTPPAVRQRWRVRGTLRIEEPTTQTLTAEGEGEVGRQRRRRAAARWVSEGHDREGGAVRYRKKPVVIEAKQWDGLAFNILNGPWRDFLGWPDAGKIYACGETGQNLAIETLEGKMIASPGDWIIRGVKGEFYPCKPDIFEATYEPVE